MKEGKSESMKKQILGVTLILFSIMLYILGEVEHISLFYNDVVRVIYVILPFLGMVFGIWGFVEKEK